MSTHFELECQNVAFKKAILTMFNLKTETFDLKTQKVKIVTKLIFNNQKFDLKPEILTNVDLNNQNVAFKTEILTTIYLKT